MKRLFTLVATLVLLLGAGITSVFAQGDGAVRFAHAVPGVGGVDVYINGTLSVSNLEFGEASNYMNAPAGSHTVTVRPAGLGQELWSQDVEVLAGSAATFVASSPSAPAFVGFSDDLAALAAGTTRLKIIHAIEGAPAVTVTANGQTVVDGLNYGEFIGGFDIPADNYAVTVNVAGGGDVVIPEASIGLNTGTSHLVLAAGTVDAPQAIVLSTATEGDANSGFVRVVHGVAGGPPVDVYANDTLIIPNLAFGVATGHLALPAGDYALDVRAQGSTDSLLSADVTVEAGVAATIVAQGTLEEVGAGVYVDDISGVNPDTAVVSLINVIPGESSVGAELDDLTVLASGVAFGTNSEATGIAPTTQGVNAIITLDGITGALPLEEMTFYGGVYYNAVAVDGTTFTTPTILFFPTALAQGVNSAPASELPEVVELPATPEPSTPEPVAEAPATEPPVEAAPTNPPVAPVILTEEPKPTARIALDPGVNLQLRQFPSASALSLGLAPAGASVIVNGRAGDIAPNEDGTLNIPLPLQETFGQPDFEWVDPVTLLDPNDPRADLAPEETWINFTYTTPDGGEIDAWTIALYLDIVTPDGEPQALRDLELVPSNLEGEARATDVTPPAAREDLVTARVVGLDPGANLNIRRTPDTQGEVLGRIPSGAVAEVEGFGASGEWVFISYQPGEGGVYNGWVSIGFLEFELNGEAADIEDLQERGVYEEVDEETLRGSVSASASAPSEPTRDPQRDAYVAEVLLNPDANLNLRRTPDVQAEVIARIPDASLVIVESRSADALWLKTSYEGVEGWIASDFVAVTFNGRLITDLTEIPVEEIAPEATATPGA